jgi:hypothetical protein
MTVPNSATLLPTSSVASVEMQDTWPVIARIASVAPTGVTMVKAAVVTNEQLAKEMLLIAKWRYVFETICLPSNNRE